MRDPLTWSLPIGRAFGITIRVHILFIFVTLVLLGRVAFMKDVRPGTWLDAVMLYALLFVVILLHEFGHCFGARRVDGDAHEILMWPLGGLAYVEVPRTAWANFVTVAAGPAVNVLICLVAGLGFLWATGFDLRLPWNPVWYPFRINPEGAVELYRWNGTPESVSALGVIVLARLFWLSWVTFLFNMVLVGYPMDAGRLFQCALWPRFGYHQATLAAVYAGFATSLLLGVVAVWKNELLLLCLALFIYHSCKMQWLELIQVEEGMFGYDFSQGYTSLEGDAPPQARRKKPNFVQRWLQKRAAKKLQREQEQRESDERRMDELLQKVQDQGIQALTEEERRFMTRVSARYKNRQ